MIQLNVVESYLSLLYYLKSQNISKHIDIIKNIIKFNIIFYYQREYNKNRFDDDQNETDDNKDSSTKDVFSLSRIFSTTSYPNFSLLGKKKRYTKYTGIPYDLLIYIINSYNKKVQHYDIDIIKFLCDGESIQQIKKVIDDFKQIHQTDQIDLSIIFASCEGSLLFDTVAKNLKKYMIVEYLLINIKVYLR